VTATGVDLARLIESLEQGESTEIVFTRDGMAVARLLPMDARVSGQRLGIAKGLFEVPDDIDGTNAEVARLFGTSG
jgi:antitoxin (DNA-binding transcriptional repressor) of toxin-antitoxin stability system